MSRFKKGEFNKAKTILFWDLEALKDYRTNKKEFDYHFMLLKGNLKDLYGVKE